MTLNGALEHLYMHDNGDGRETKRWARRILTVAYQADMMA